MNGEEWDILYGHITSLPMIWRCGCLCQLLLGPNLPLILGIYFTRCRNKLDFKASTEHVPFKLPTFSYSCLWKWQKFGNEYPKGYIEDTLGTW